jgi:hypothetical protein
VFREHRVKTPNSTKLAFAPKDAGPDRDRANDLFHTKGSGHSILKPDKIKLEIGVPASS